MKDLRGSEQPIGDHYISLEKEVFGIKHSAFWRDLEADIDRVIKNAQDAVLTKPDFTLQEISHLQGIYLMAKKVKNYPETFLNNQKDNQIEQ